jgi:hypothetical protein
MRDATDWQGRAWNGRPDAPELSGWHWIEDGDGLRPLLWRGADWPEPLDRDEWQDGFTVLSPGSLARAGIYYGPLGMPPTVAARFRLELLAHAV